MRFFPLVSLLLFASVSIKAQDFAAQFDKAGKAKDTLKMRQVLQEWRTQDRDASELITREFNYYFYISRTEMLSLTTEEPDGEKLVLMDSTEKVAGFLGSEIFYDDSLLKRSMKAIDRGIGLYPDRLDMRFGKIYALGQAQLWNEFTSEIVSTIEYSGKNMNKWTWTNDQPQPDGKEFMLGSIQDYQLQLYNTEDDGLLPNMRSIAEAVLKLYPDHIESLSNLSITYMLQNKYDKAIGYLLKAEKLAPSDQVIIANLAHAYNLKKDRKKAIAYYTKLKKVGDAPSQQFAEEQLNLLKE